MIYWVVRKVISFFLMKVKDDFLIVNKYFIELYIVHSVPVSFAIFLAVA